MLAALPLAVLAGSPQRVILSALIAAAYVFAAVGTLRRELVNRVLIAYVAVVAIWMLASWLRARYALHLQPEQLAYATSKTAYFVLIVLPMAAAVAVMVDRPEAIWPAAVAQVAVGAVVALVTVVSLGDHFLGADRYSWQGNLIALGTVLAIQPWPIHRIRASAILGVVGVVGVMLAGSRQALAAAAVGLVLSALYWGASRYLGGAGTAWSRLRSAVSGGYVILPLALLLLTAGYLAVTYAGYAGVHLWGGASTSSSCHCVTDRIVSLETNAGDRDKLLAHGMQLSLSNPILGAGLGSFAGAVPDSLHPGHFYQYPHNVPLEIASETGIVGALLILFPLLLGWAALFWHGVKLASAPIASTLMLLAIFFTVANVSGDIPSERGLWIFGIVAFKLGVDYIWSRHRSRNMARAA